MPGGDQFEEESTKDRARENEKAPGGSGREAQLPCVQFSVGQEMGSENKNISDQDTQGRGETGSIPASCYADLQGPT